MSKLSMSKAGLLNVLAKIHLEPGDILVVKDYETLKFLSEVHLPLAFHVPLVFSPKGVEVLNREDLMNLLEQFDQTRAPESLPDSAHAPL